MLRKSGFVFPTNLEFVDKCHIHIYIIYIYILYIYILYIYIFDLKKPKRVSVEPILAVVSAMIIQNDKTLLVNGG